MYGGCDVGCVARCIFGNGLRIDHDQAAPPLATQVTIQGVLFLAALLAHFWLLFLVRKIVVARGRGCSTT